MGGRRARAAPNGAALRSLLAATAAAWIASDAALFACPICFRVEENATTAGVQAAVLVLVGITTAVLGACGAFVVRFARREAREATRTQIPDSRSQIPDS